MADIFSEKWMKGVAITTAILAVVAAIAASRSSFFVAKAQLLTALEGSQWGYYQAKSIKQYLFETQKQTLEINMLGATTPDQKDQMAKDIRQYAKDIGRYNIEKGEIQQQAEATNKENALVVKRGGQFSLAVVFAQIGIMLSSVGALLKRKELWGMGVAIGSISLIFLTNGFLLLF